MNPAKLSFVGNIPPHILYMTRVFDTAGGNRTLAVTPAVGDLLVVIAQASGTISLTVADNQGGTYSSVASAIKNTSLDGLSIFVRDQPVASAVSHSITMTAGANTGSGMAVFRVTGMGRYGALASRTSGSQINQTVAATPAPVLATQPLLKNPIICCCYTETTTTAPARAGYTSHFDEGYLTPGTAWSCYTRDAGEASQTITYGGAVTSAKWAACAIELNGP